MHYGKPSYAIIGLAFSAVSILLFSQFALAVSSNNVATFNQWSTVHDCNFLVFSDGTTTYAKNCDTGAISHSGSDTDAVIQLAMDGLTAGRTWKETIVLKGSLTVNSQMNVPSYTHIIIDGKITQAASTALGGVFKNKNAGVSLNSNIEIEGGTIDGNKANGASAHIIFLDGVTDSSIHDSNILNAGGPAGRGIYVVTSHPDRQTKNIQLDNLLLHGANDSNIEIAGSILFDIYEGAVYGVSITNVISTDTGGRGLVFTNTHNSVVNGMIVNNTGHRGIDLSYQSEDNALSNFYIGFTKLDGLTVANSPGTEGSNRNVFSNFVIYNATQSGIGVGNDVQNQVFTNFIVNASGWHGMRIDGDRCIIADGVIKNNGKSSAGVYDGILIQNSDKCFIHNNHFYDTQAVKTQRYGIAIGGNATNIRVSENDVTGNVQSAGLINAGTGSVIHDNAGYITENSGLATATTTATAVAHGLSYTPSAGEVNITFRENPSTDPTAVWITTNATHFVLNLDQDPGASDLDFGWSIE